MRATKQRTSAKNGNSVGNPVRWKMSRDQKIQFGSIWPWKKLGSTSFAIGFMSVYGKGYVADTVINMMATETAASTTNATRKIRLPRPNAMGIIMNGSI